MEVEYIAASEAINEDMWQKNFLMNLEVIPSAQPAIALFYDNSRVVANSKEPRSIREENT